MEELNYYMEKVLKIKEIVNRYEKDLCPRCGYSLFAKHKYETSRVKYKCKGCGLSFSENQFAEMYFDEVEKVIKE